MLDRISGEPWAFFGGILVWIPIAIWIISLVHWTVQGDVDVLVSLPGMLVAVVLGVLTMSPPDPRLSPVFFGTVMMTVLFFPFVKAALNKRALHRVDVEQLEKAYEVLHQKPANVGCELRIARILYDKGLPGHAIGIAERVLQNSPGSIFAEEQRMLAQWRAASHGRNLNEQILCVDCGVKNSPGRTHCTRCGAPYPMDYLKGRLVGGSMARKLIGAWIAAVAAIAGMPLISTTLPPSMALPAIFGLVVFVTALIWLAFKPKGVGA